MVKRILPAIRDFVQILVDGWGKPGVSEDGGVRSLQFSNGAVQSSMRVSKPFELDLSYTRAMMGFLLFNAEPQHILLVGLGGGSLSKYCYHQFPQARITVVRDGVTRSRDAKSRDRIQEPPAKPARLRQSPIRGRWTDEKDLIDAAPIERGVHRG